MLTGETGLTGLTAESFRDYMQESYPAWVHKRELANDLSVVTDLDKTYLRVLIKRAFDDKNLVKDSKNNSRIRWVDRDATKIDVLSTGKDSIIKIKTPFAFEDYVDLYPKNLVVVAGSPNSGKTALLLNVAAYSMNTLDIVYYTSEMGVEELRLRLDKFQDIDIDDWAERVDFRERSENFADVVVPDKINLIDYMELTDDLYRVNQYLTEIQQKLTTGCAFVALQRN